MNRWAWLLIFIGSALFAVYWFRRPADLLVEPSKEVPAVQAPERTVPPPTTMPESGGGVPGNRLDNPSSNNLGGSAPILPQYQEPRSIEPPPPSSNYEAPPPIDPPPPPPQNFNDPDMGMGAIPPSPFDNQPGYEPPSVSPPPDDDYVPPPTSVPDDE